MLEKHVASKNVSKSLTDEETGAESSAAISLWSPGREGLGRPLGLENV